MSKRRNADTLPLKATHEEAMDLSSVMDIREDVFHTITSSSGSNKSRGGYYLSRPCVELFWMRLSNFFRRVYKLMPFLAIISLVPFILFRSMLHPTEISEFSSEDSVFGKHIGSINHWCLLGGNDDCSCLDPTEARPRVEKKGWLEAHEKNVKLIEDALEKKNVEKKALPEEVEENGGTDVNEVNDEDNSSNDIDVVFLGDSIIEGWTGMDTGRPSKRAEGIEDIWKRYFTKEGGGEVDGLALGIEGDTSPNLLWRLKNGELPKDLNPKVWWILIGTNDLGSFQCSEQVVLFGILRVVEEIGKRKPGSTIVVNGLLPRTFRGDGKLTMDANNAKRDKKTPNLWPALKTINAELEAFCEQHSGNGRLQYVETSDLFIGSLGNKHFRVQDQQIMAELMPDHLHPSAIGYELWAKTIMEKLEEILHIEKIDPESDGEEADGEGEDDEGVGGGDTEGVEKTEDDKDAGQSEAGIGDGDSDGGGSGESGEIAEGNDKQGEETSEEVESPEQAEDKTVEQVEQSEQETEETGADETTKEKEDHLESTSDSNEDGE